MWSSVGVGFCGATVLRDPIAATKCEGSREGFARIAATIDMENFLKMSSYFTHNHFDHHYLFPSSFFIQKYNRMNVGSDRLHFTQKEEGRVGVIHKITK